MSRQEIMNALFLGQVPSNSIEEKFARLMHGQ